jgi:NDP-sugar pyrophosphorylase family protein
VLPPVAILAGGLGTRLGEITASVPKPLVEVAGEPFLFHQIRLLSRHGATRVVLLVGHLGALIETAVGAERDGIEIAYSYDAPGLDGTLGAIRRALPLLGERFLVLYGDTYLRIDYAAFAQGWDASGKLGAMSVFRNDDELDRSNTIVRDGRIVLYDKFHHNDEMHWIDYGLGGLEAAALSIVGPEVTDLALLDHELSLRGELFGFEATERFYEIGTPESRAETDAALRHLADGA